MKTPNKIVFAYILSAICPEAYDVEANTEKERLQFLANAFKDEYCSPENLTRYGSYQNVMREWIMGLPSAFSIELRADAILELARQWGSIPENASEKIEEKVLANWFNFIASKTLRLFRKHQIEL